jgi:hypothetical protein
VQGIGPATAADLAARGITSVGQLARATPTGQAATDNGIIRARTIRDRTSEVTRELVQAQPDIPDVGAFLNRRLADVQPADLVAVQVSIATANQIVAAINGVVGVTTEPNLRLSDLLSP